jgi:hypothetical protein
MAPNNSKRAIQRASNCTPNITEGLKTLRNRSEELENPNSNEERALQARKGAIRENNTSVSSTPRALWPRRISAQSVTVSVSDTYLEKAMTRKISPLNKRRNLARGDIRDDASLPRVVTPTHHRDSLPLTRPNNWWVPYRARWPLNPFDRTSRAAGEKNLPRLLNSRA